MPPVEDTGQLEWLDDLLVRTSRTFALSIPRLPLPLRHQVTVAYLLFRIADTLEDATHWSPRLQVEQLAALGGALDAKAPRDASELAAGWLANPPLDHDGYLDLLRATPRVIAELESLTEPARSIVREHTLRTAERMAGFAARRENRERLELTDLEDLRAYCYAVAGIVGEMLTELFVAECRLGAIEATLRSRAALFGEALQLVNILKDASADAGEGRRYLPGGVERADVFALARQDLEQAGIYVRALQRARAPRGVVAFTALPVLLAWRTLERVETDGPGAKVSREDVMRIAAALEDNLDHDRPAVRENAARLDSNTRS